ncbi:lipocalin family protein [Flavobacterium davisii]|uniref:lipocalin family protein n=1 Tax=Flavobacterium davisii TaxID=2906077 RepID=UPI0035D02B47
MKNVLKIAFLLVVTIISNACSKEEEKKNEIPMPTIVGKWEFSKKIDYNELGQEQFRDYVNKCGTSKDYLLIELNKSYTEAITPSNCQPEINKTTYVYENNELKLVDFSYKLKIISLTANELKVQYLNNSKSRAGIDTYLLIKK